MRVKSISVLSRLLAVFSADNISNSEVAAEDGVSDLVIWVPPPTIRRFASIVGVFASAIDVSSFKVCVPPPAIPGFASEDALITEAE